ncbi:MAG: D-glycerate dehydrogenase [Desulfobacterales bacterium]|nr:MAG: D-glycerate dehydrogenase [Desulfobacterales bacterium]
MGQKKWKTYYPSGNKRVVVTKELPGNRWLDILTRADCQVDVCTSTDILSLDDIKNAIGDRCDGAIGQLTEDWGDVLFKALKLAGGKAYSNCAVGFNNVDLDAASNRGIPVGNTPGVLTETTAEMAVALTFAAARRVVEADTFMREGRYKGWLPTLFLGELLRHKTVGVVGAGRIGSVYAKMMVEGFKMNLIYYDLYQNKALEDYVVAYGDFLNAMGEDPIWCKRAGNIEELLRDADVVSIHTILDESTYHLINKERLQLMKENAILVNTSRGPVIDESALVDHCQAHPQFMAALDVFEDEPEMKPGLKDLHNVVIVPHIASATRWTREGMATLAASNVAGILMGYPAWQRSDITPFLGKEPPRAAPSILNAKEVGVTLYHE